jgi:hypothetical protein
MSTTLLECFASKYFHMKKDCYVLTYTDLDELFTKEKIVKYINDIITKNKILSQKIIEINNNLYLTDVNEFNIHDYYSIVNTNHIEFDNYTDDIFNRKLDTALKWQFLWCIDETLKKTRMYFKIHHSYVDGYTLIHILTSPFDNQDITKKFKRKTNTLNTIYYCIIGTIFLIILHIRVFINNILDKIYNQEAKTPSDFTKKKNDYIIFESFNFNEIKTFTKKHNITINDFLYSLMIKTDNKYRKEKKILKIMSPINISGVKQITNIFGMCNIISNSQDNYSLIKNVNNIFNCLKYSLFIPILSLIINNITLFLFTKYFTNDINKCDYVFTNMIGPSTKDYEYKTTNIHIMCNPEDKEIIYNIISYDNNINIICCFKEGVIENKEEYKKCLYEACKEFIQLE